MKWRHKCPPPSWNHCKSQTTRQPPSTEATGVIPGIPFLFSLPSQTFPFCQAQDPLSRGPSSLFQVTLRALSSAPSHCIDSSPEQGSVLSWVLLELTFSFQPQSRRQTQPQTCPTASHHVHRRHSKTNLRRWPGPLRKAEDLESEHLSGNPSSAM